jgi:hypothetical protein
MPRYWAMRTDRENKELIFCELQQGRLRQGWGYDASQGLNRIRQERDGGGAWWERLTSLQKEVLPHFRMLGSGEDSIQRGDLILLPNLPVDGRFCLARVNGDYRFEMLQLEPDQQKHGLTQDYGHILPVELFTPNGVNGYAAQVPAEIRQTLRARSRLWNVDRYGPSIDGVLAAVRGGEDVLQPQLGNARLQYAWEAALSQANNTLREAFAEGLARNFRAAEWEEPIVRAMRGLFGVPAAEISWTGGAGEHGADLVINLGSPFSDSTWKILIQVKNYDGAIADPTALQQLRQAYQYYGAQAPVLELVVMTTATTEDENFQKNRQELANELGVPVVIILRDRLIELMVDGLKADSAF